MPQDLSKMSLDRLEYKIQRVSAGQQSEIAFLQTLQRTDLEVSGSNLIHNFIKWVLKSKLVGLKQGSTTPVLEGWSPTMPYWQQRNFTEDRHFRTGVVDPCFKVIRVKKQCKQPDA